MVELITEIKALGAFSLNLFWLPVVIWTALAITAAGISKLLSDLPAVYQYHGRVAVLWALPAGILASGLLKVYAVLSASPVPAFTAKFIVIQNPITVTASAPAASVNWAEPTLWIGFLTLATALLAIAGIFRLIANFVTLQSFTKELNGGDEQFYEMLSGRNKKLLKSHCPNTTVTFSDAVAIPCTFGWKQKRVVLPESIRSTPVKLNMALRHELMHIRQHDYLLNTTLQGIKSLFYFHPLVHVLVKQAAEYRELFCDQSVLADPEISHKKYAELLFELAPKAIMRTSAAVNMAVYPSTLKKRIQTMKKKTPSPPSMKKSIIVMLVTGLLFTGIIACSDLEEGGITNSEIEQTQANIDKAPADGSPLYVLNGEEIKQKDIIGKLKPKYIESIEVLKDNAATAVYGEAGKNGVIKIELIDKEKAFEDLRTDAEMEAMNERVDRPVDPNIDFFVAVENPPKLIGGIGELQKKVEYPERCRRAGIEGRVMVQFIVNKKGEVEDPNIIRGLGGGCDEAAVAAVKQAKFKPGLQRGQAVRVQMSLPILFRLNDDNS